MAKDKLPIVTERALQEASQRITFINKKVKEIYQKTNGNEAVTQEALDLLITKEIEVIANEQPILCEWLVKALMLMKLANTSTSTADLLIFIIVMYNALRIQAEIDDLQNLFDGFDKEGN